MKKKKTTPSKLHPSPTALYWLPISERIKYQTVCMCYITYNAITGSAPSYLSELLHLYSPSHSLHSNSNASTAKPMAFALFHTLAPTSGTISPKTSGTLSSFKSKLKTVLFSQYVSEATLSITLSVGTVCVRVLSLIHI